MKVSSDIAMAEARFHRNEVSGDWLDDLSNWVVGQG